MSEPIAHVFGDLHLDPGGGPAVDEFCGWLDGIQSPRIVILGDLFEAWFGPRTGSLSGARAVLESLLGAVERGIPVDVVPGNRDFLLGSGFETRTGAVVRHGGVALPVEGGALVLHGDELCTRDRGYLRLRAVLRNPAIVALAQVLPRWAGAAVARRLRRASVAAVAAKPSAEKQMQPAAAAAALEAASSDLLVVGHAHEFRVSELGPGQAWVVLDGWGGERDVLEVHADGSYIPMSHRAVQGAQDHRAVAGAMDHRGVEGAPLR